MDMETSDEEEEDGQFTKYDEEEERDRKLFSKVAPEEDKPITIEDLHKCQLTRDLIAKHCMAPWFEDYVKGVFCLFYNWPLRADRAYRCLDTVSAPRRSWYIPDM